MKKTTFIISLFLLLPFISYTQENTDSMFNQVLQLSKQENLEQAIDLSKKILRIDAKRDDVVLFLARLYSWTKEYEEAKALLSGLHEKNPANKEIYEVWLNVLLWNQEFKDLLNLADLALKNGYPDLYNLHVKRLLAHKTLGNYQEALTLASARPEFKDSTQVKYLIQEIVKLKHRNPLNAYISLDYFKENNFHFYTYVDFKQELFKTHSLVFRLNYAYKFDESDFLPEIDYYHVLSTKSYLYVNYGFGIRKLAFPGHRAGIEYFHSTSKEIDLSIGARFLDFSLQSVYILTGHIKYNSSFGFISIRPYYAFIENEQALSLVADLRIRGKNEASYSAVQMGYGYSPDDNYRSAEERISLNALWIKAEQQLPLSIYDQVRAGLRYAFEETGTLNPRHRLTVEFTYIHNF